MESSKARGVAHILVARPQGGSDASGWGRALQGIDRGVSIQLVYDAASCARLCSAVRVDLLVLDAALETTESRRILAQVRNGGPPVIVAHGEVDARVSAAWRAQGASACVCDAAELRAAVRQLLSGDGAEHGAESGSPVSGAAYEAIVRGLHSALLVVDAGGRITFCNEPGRQILAAHEATLEGCALDACLGGPLAPEHPLTRARLAGERFDAVETSIRRADGSSVPVGLSCGPLRDAAGQPAGVVALFRDLSEARRLRGDVLQREKMASIGQLAAGVAHEINNPMGFIHANLFQMSEYVTELRQVWSRVEALQKAAMAGDTEAARRAAEELSAAAEEADVAFLLTDLTKAIRESQEGSERVRHIVQDLRDFSHPDSGERVLADLSQCLDSTANIVWPMMKHKVVLERDYAELPDVPCYPMQLKQVFMNLLMNAYQAIEDRVGDTGEVGTIRLVTSRLDDGVSVSVSDTGVGIASEDRQRIFDPFFTTKKVGVGMGLGLSTSFKIVERHGGSFSVESEVGVGTTVRLDLPLLRTRDDPDGFPDP